MRAAKNRLTWRKVLLAVILAVLAGIVLTVLAAVPPLSFLKDWTECRQLDWIWAAFSAAVVALVVSLYLVRARTRGKDSGQEESAGIDAALSK